MIKPASTDCSSAITRNLPTMWTRFDRYTDSSTENRTLSEPLWDDILPSHGIVAMNLDWASQRQWPQSMRLPSDRTKGVYLLEAYHLLHCLVIEDPRLSTFKRLTYQQGIIRKTFWPHTQEKSMRLLNEDPIQIKKQSNALNLCPWIMSSSSRNLVSSDSLDVLILLWTGTSPWWLMLLPRSNLEMELVVDRKKDSERDLVGPQLCINAVPTLQENCSNRCHCQNRIDTRAVAIPVMVLRCSQYKTLVQPKWSSDGSCQGEGQCISTWIGNVLFASRWANMYLLGKHFCDIFGCLTLLKPGIVIRRSALRRFIQSRSRSRLSAWSE